MNPGPTPSTSAEPVAAPAASSDTAGAAAAAAQIQQPAEASGAQASEAAAAALAEAVPVASRPRVGSVLRGTVVAVGSDQLVVDIGGKSEGVVPLSEVMLPAGKTLGEAFAPGQSITVTVLGYEADDGTPRLSQRRPAQSAVWKTLEHALQTGEPIEAPVTEAVRGGLVLDAGVRAFMPASHVERVHVPDLSVYVGQSLRARVIELDRGRGKVILSRKALLEEELRQKREALWASLEEGQVRQGVVKSLTDFGAFVDLGGVDGLLHVSAMAWGRVERPSDVVSVGDQINVKILKVDRENQRISLGLKQLLPDPWTTVAERYPVGAVVEGTVSRLAAFGAFVELEPGIDGLVHVSQMADRHVRSPEEVVQEGERVRVRVLRVIPEERRISLSMREADQTRPSGGPARTSRAAPRDEGGVTVGEMVGDLGHLWSGRPGTGGTARQRGGEGEAGTR